MSKTPDRPYTACISSSRPPSVCSVLTHLFTTLDFLSFHARWILVNDLADAAPLADPSLADLVERVLPLGTYYTGITAFIEQRSHLDFGLVNHALCAAVRDMLKVGVYVPH
jgi:hypothetical protein